MTKVNTSSETQLTDMYQSNLPLANWVSKSWLQSTQQNLHDDILAEARVGLWKACKTFDSNIGCKFSTYAVPVIYNSIGTFMRKQNKHSCVISLDASLTESDSLAIADLVGYEPDFESGMQVNILLEKLGRYKYLKMMVQGKTQCEIAHQTGYSQPHVSRLLSNERKRFREEVAN